MGEVEYLTIVVVLMVGFGLVEGREILFVGCILGEGGECFGCVLGEGGDVECFGCVLGGERE
jgi:hypothetical protein